MKNKQGYSAIKTVSLKERRRAITRLTDWMTRIKGKLFAHRGRNACDAEIDRLRHRCFAVEHAMCEELEQSIRHFHVDSSLNWLKSVNKETPPETPDPEDGPIALRAAEVAKNRYEATVAAARSAKEEIVRIHEVLISAEHSFYQNVEQLRAYTSTKIEAFITGVRSSKNTKLSDYRTGENVVFDGSAYTSYKLVHEENDLIRTEFLEKLKEVV